MVVYTFDPSTQEAETGASLEVSQGYLVRHCCKKITKLHFPNPAYSFTLKQGPEGKKLASVT